ncbi:hypothetical protein NQ317_016446 [Molorchus minor]|uniref:Uncharacterized protein n=1 Tax=Molorchus minor TaxID=1323400 RepID=A0ABQ9JZV6_9CUCU|nr:hypothetical protein NQ317_016446 [Molorchus minor]
MNIALICFSQACILSDIDGQTAFDLADSDMLSYLEDLKKKQDKDEVMNRRQAKKRIETHNRPTEAETPSKVKKVEVEISTEEKNETKVSDHIDLIKSSDLIGENELPLKKVPQNEELNVKDDKNKINISTVNVSNTNKTSTPLVSSQVNNQQPREQPLRSDLKLEIKENKVNTGTSPTNTPTPTSSGGNRLQMFKNFFKSFVPPVRDEESETQRKAHAKRVRETDPNAFSTTVTSVAATITTASPTVITRETDDSNVIHERRPSWRLKVDNNSAKFKLEDATKTSESPSTPSFIRRNNATNSVPRPSSAPVETETTVTLSLRRPKSVEEKEQDKENDIRNAQASLATQATIQRRRRRREDQLE